MKRLPLLLAFAIMLQACGSGTDASTETTETSETEEQMFDQIPDHAEDENGMSYEEYLNTYTDPDYTLQEAEHGGVYSLLALEDGGYPRATLLATHVSTGDSVWLYVMLEGGFGGYTSEQLHEAVSNKHDVYLVYSEKLELYPGLMVENGDKDTGEVESVTGTLDVRAENMGGDLPGHFTVVKDNGDKMVFTDFFDESLVAMNGKKVKLYYEEHRTNELKYVSKVK